VSAFPAIAAIDAVLLDAGETLIFMQPSFIGAFVVVARESGFDLTEEDVKPGLQRVSELLEERARTRPDLATHQSSEVAMWREFNRIIFSTAGLGPGDAETMAVAMQAAFNEGRINRAGADTVETLRRLRAAGLKLAIVSNAVSEMRNVLEVCGVAGEVEHISISADVGWEKPDPRIFQDALGALGVEADRAIHVGDSPGADLGGARGAGLAGAVLFLNGKPKPAGIKSPAIHRLSELVGLLGLD
jgi:putative hydrolase of the HAD superfamily